MSNARKASYHSSGDVAAKWVKPGSPISVQAPTGLTTKGTATAMYWIALKPDLPADHGSSTIG